MNKEKRTPRQWHPAFFADIQIEFEVEAHLLHFENEHQLATKPMEIDVLIIKKEADVPIRKNIGQIFRKYNIFEYKSPTDSLRIDDFYKVYGYACFYKADTGDADEIRIADLTISFVSERYPRKLLKHLTAERGFSLERKFPGVYWLIGDVIPMQFIITKELSEETNLWLKSLTNNLTDSNVAMALLQQYERNKEKSVYQSAMDMIMRANQKLFEEGDEAMCEMYEKILQEKFAEKLAKKDDEVSKKLAEKDAELAQKDTQIHMLKEQLRKAGIPIPA